MRQDLATLRLLFQLQASDTVAQLRAWGWKEQAQEAEQELQEIAEALVAPEAERGSSMAFFPTISVDLELITVCAKCGEILGFEAKQDKQGIITLRVPPCPECSSVDYDED